MQLGGGNFLHAQTTPTNYVAGWDGGSSTGKPTSYGWASTNSNRSWGDLNGGGARMTTSYSNYKYEDGSNYPTDNRMLWIRYADNNADTYTYTFTGLEAGHFYSFSGLVGWHNNSSNPTFTVAVEGTSSYASASKSISTKQKLYNVSFKFVVPANETATSFKLKFTSSTGGDCMEAIAALSVIEDFDAYRTELSRLISSASHINTTLNNSDLATAITTAQYKVDDTENNVTYNDLSSLRSTLATAISNGLVTGDVSYLIYNSGFELSEAISANQGTGTSKDYSTTGWKALSTSTSNSCGAVVAYGSSYTINGATAPTSDNNSASGNALGISVGWSTTVAYQSSEITLPAGFYTMTVYGYNNNSGGSNFTSKNGFITNSTSSTSYLSTKTSFTNGEWKTDVIQFTLTEPTAGVFQIGGTAGNNTSGSHAKVFFDNITLTYKSPLTLAKEAWDEAVEAANQAKTDCPNVTGKELADLNTELGKTEPTTVEGYNAAKEALEGATNTFTAAKSAYDTFVAAKAVNYEDDLPYASAEKFAAIATAQAAADATSAADATAKTNAIISAYRKYVESNALAEGVTGAEDKTSLISDPNMDVTYDGTNHTFGAWQVFGQTDGTIKLLSEESFTDGEGNANYKYADIWKSDNNAGIQQTVNLEPGKYLLTVTARANNTADATFKVFAGGTNADIQRIGNTGGVFDRGWNDASVEFVVNETSDVSIGVQSGNGKNLWWSATRFRLVKLAGTEDVKMTMKANKWGTFIAPFDVTIPNGVNAYTVTGVDANGYMVKNNVTTTISANTPVLLENTNDVEVDETFTGVNIAEDDSYTKGLLTGIYTAATIPAGSYVLQTPESTREQAFYPLASDLTGGTPNRCYLTLPASAAKRNAIFFDKEEGTTGIEAPNATNGEDGVFYNLAGQRVNRSYKGIIIQNRKAKLNN